MRFYLDTEFNGFGGALISLALVAENVTSSFYEVAPLPDVVDPWVAEHVIPKLYKDPLPTLPLFRARLHSFLLQFEQPEIIADWHRDLELFFEALAGDDYGTSLDYACTARLLKTPPGAPGPSTVPHNALHDAYALRDWHTGTVLTSF